VAFFWYLLTLAAWIAVSALLGHTAAIPVISIIGQSLLAIKDALTVVPSNSQ
jgi:hypothetical protein